MPTLLLIRHAENDFTRKGRLAGHLPDVHLNARGREQARQLAEALKHVPLRAIYASPLERALETAAPIAAAHRLEVQIEAGLLETHVGRWQGQPWRVLRRTKAWKIVQSAPSRFRFPDGETFYECQTRVVAALEVILSRHRPKDVLACVFHADPIKLAVAHYLGLPLDHFQRLACDTASVTLLALGETHARLLWLNRRPPFEWEAASGEARTRPHTRKR